MWIANLNRLIYGSVKKVGNLEYRDFSKQPFRKRVPCTQCHPIVFEKTLLFKRQIQTFLGKHSYQYETCYLKGVNICWVFCPEKLIFHHLYLRSAHRVMGIY